MWVNEKGQHCGENNSQIQFWKRLYIVTCTYCEPVWNYKTAKMERGGERSFEAVWPNERNGNEILCGFDLNHFFFFFVNSLLKTFLFVAGKLEMVDVEIETSMNWKHTPIFFLSTLLYHQSLCISHDNVPHFWVFEGLQFNSPLLKMK